MKKILLLITLMFLNIFTGCGFNGHNFYDDTPTGYHFVRQGTMANPDYSYEIKTLEDGTVTLSYTRFDPVVTILKAPAGLLEEIGRIVRDCRIYNIKERYLPPMTVLDGYMWSMDIYYPEGKIYSHGSNAKPSGDIREGISQINALIAKVIEEASEEDVIGHDML